MTDTHDIEARLRIAAAGMRDTGIVKLDGRSLADEAADEIARLRRSEPTLTHLWGQPVSEMRHALEFLEQFTGTTEIRAAVKRLTLVLKGQRALIASQGAMIERAASLFGESPGQLDYTARCEEWLHDIDAARKRAGGS